MSVTSTVISATYDGDGENKEFILPFGFMSGNDLVVLVDGAPVFAFTTSGEGGAAGGAIIFDAAPATGTANVYVERSTPRIQPVSLNPGGPFRPEVIENALDRMEMQLQEIAGGGGGGGGGGTVTEVTGVAPISVLTGTSTPEISMLDATPARSGHMTFAQAAKLASLGDHNTLSGLQGGDAPAGEMYHLSAAQLAAVVNATLSTEERQFMEGATSPIGLANPSVFQQDFFVDEGLYGGQIRVGSGNVLGNTVFGVDALAQCTAGANIGIGAQAGSTLTTGSYNIAVGIACCGAEFTAEGSGNLGIGYRALMKLTTGSWNIGLGYDAGKAILDADANIFIGGNSGVLHSGGDNNVGVGYGTLGRDTSGVYNVAVGHQAGHCGNQSNYNTFVGASSGGQENSESALNNSYNTGVGSSALGLLTSGQYNSALGAQALQYNVPYPGGFTYSNCTGLGYRAEVTGSNQVQLGNSTTTTYAYGAVQNRSDSRDKADVQDTKLGLSFIKALRPVDFKWDMREDYEGKEKDGSKKRGRFHHGLIAQEVKQVMDQLGIDFGGYQDHSIAGGKDVLSLGYTELVGPLIRAIQELAAEIDKLKGGT